MIDYYHDFVIMMIQLKEKVMDDYNRRQQNINSSMYRWHDDKKENVIRDIIMAIVCQVMLVIVIVGVMTF